MEAVKFKKIYIEISNICNLKCDFCPTVDRNKQVMSLENFESILVQAAPLAERICLHLMGEPLGHPHLAEVLEICQKQNVFVELTTNGVLIPRKTEDLMNPAVQQVNISVHSFEANFPEKDIQPYLDKVFEFVETALHIKPNMYINLRVWDLSDPLALSSKNKKIRDYIEQKYDFSFSDLKIDIRRKKGFKIFKNLYLHFDSRFEWPSLTRDVIQTKGTCHGLSHHVGIHADGTVVPCCLDKEADMALGNCLKTSLTQIIAGDRAQKMRQGFKDGVLIEDLCKRCDYISRFNRKL